MRASCVERHSNDGSLYLILPPRSAKSGKCRNKIDTAIALDAGSDGFGLGGAADELHLVGHPLQCSSCAVDIPFVGIVGLAEYRKANGGDQAFGGLARFLSDVQHHGRTCAVCHFARACIEAHLTNQGTMRIAQHAGNLNGLFKKTFHRCRAVAGIAGTRFGKHRSRNAGCLEQLVVPHQPVDIEDHGATRVGIIGRKRLSPCQFPHQPAIDGSNQEFASICLGTRAWNVVENPANLACAKVGVNLEACMLLDELLHAWHLAPLTAKLSAARILPHKGMADWSTCLLVPCHDGLTLIGNRQRIVVGIQFPTFEQQADGPNRVPIDFFRIVLHPSCLRVILLVCHRRTRQEPALFVEEQRLGSRCALVNRNDVFHNGFWNLDLFQIFRNTGIPI